MKIGLASWIIQDGNYPDFCVGETYSFAVDFFGEALSVSATGVRKCHPCGNCLYDICARIDFKKGDLTVIDFGFHAYSEQKISGEVGQWITGKVYLGVDPFMYFETWEGQPNVPKIKSRWRIDRLFLETTPWIETSPKTFVRDASRFSEVEQNKTDAWADDNGNGAYALECTILSQGEQGAGCNPLHSAPHLNRSAK